MTSELLWYTISLCSSRTGDDLLLVTVEHTPHFESRMDVLVVAVSVVAGHFLPIAGEMPTLVTQNWPIPFT